MFSPQPLKSKRDAFDHADYLFELKYDRFRALAHLVTLPARFAERQCLRFVRNLASNIAFSLLTRDAVIDGEIVCLDSKGHPQFREFLFHRGEPCFFAFDLLTCEGKDLG